MKIIALIFGNRKIVVSIETNATDIVPLQTLFQIMLQNPVITTGTDTSPKVSVHVQKGNADNDADKFLKSLFEK